MKTLEELRAEFNYLSQQFVVCEEIFKGVKVTSKLEWSVSWDFEIVDVEFDVDSSVKFAFEKRMDFAYVNDSRSTSLLFATQTNNFIKELKNRLNTFNKDIHEFNKEDMHNYRNLHSINTFAMLKQFRIENKGAFLIFNVSFE